MENEVYDFSEAVKACQECPACGHPFSPNIGHTDACHCYDVTCARCGKMGTCCAMMVEEGDEWECPECWDRCNAAERAADSARADQTVSEVQK